MASSAAPKVRDAVKCCLAESIGRGRVRSAIEEVADDLGGDVTLSKSFFLN